MHICRLLLFVLLSFACKTSGAESWQAINAVVTGPLSEQNTVVLTLSDSGGVSKTLQTKLPLRKVKDYFAYRNKAIVIGNAGNTDLVVIFDIDDSKVDLWFYCYGPSRLEKDKLVYTEWYPNHSSRSFNDVVLVYDLSQSVEQNPILPEARMDLYPFRFGIPVYPEWNAKNRSYTNISREGGQIYSVTSPFASLSGERLCFISDEGRDALSAASKLAVVELRNEERPGSRLTEVALPFDQLKTKSSNPNTLRVTEIEELPGDRVQLAVPKWEYGVNHIITDIPR